MELVLQNQIYQNAEVAALRMQYTENVPNMVYTIVPKRELRLYRNKLTAAGFNEDNIKMSLAHKEKGFLFMAKMQSVGIPEEKAKKINEKAQTISLVEQFAALNKKLDNAKTVEEKQQAGKQLNAFIDVNAKELYDSKKSLPKITKDANLNNAPEITPPADMPEPKKSAAPDVNAKKTPPSAAAAA